MFPSFFDQKGPTGKHPDTVKASDKASRERQKRKLPRQRLPLKKKVVKGELEIACYSGNISSSIENALVTAANTDNDVTGNFTINSS